MKLVCDLGGTKVLLALVDQNGQISHECRLASADFSSFEDLLGTFLRDVTAPVCGGCFAVAGPVAADGRSARITNLPWHIDVAALDEHFGIGTVQLVNDFAGAALGVTTLGPDSLITLQAGAPLETGVKLVIGAGTGLGMAALVSTGTGWRVLPGEGGHAGFAPADALQLKVWSALHAEYGRVTAERLISGPGLAAIHRILAGEAIDAATVSTRACAGDAGATRSLAVFMAAYGAFAGDMAMALLARGGVYLAGGIAAKILPLLQDDDGPFLQAFNAKAEHAALVRQMSVHVVTDERLCLRGAAAFALQDTTV